MIDCNKRVIVTKSMLGLCGMGVCCVKDATDEEIIKTCNSENISGTKNEWCVIIRSEKDCEEHKLPINYLPIECAQDKNRVHLIVLC